MKTQIARFFAAAITVSVLGLAVGAAQAQTYGGGVPPSKLTNDINKYYQDRYPYAASDYGHHVR